MRIKSSLSQIKNSSKKLKAFVLVLLAIALPAFTLVQAQTQVALEGHTKVRNATTGTDYADSVNLKVDEVAQVEVWHHNREMPDTAKATNTRVKVDIPTAQGKTQVITGTTKADNSNEVKDSAVVNLSMDRARLDYIPGTAKFRYNKGAQDGVARCITGVNFPPDDCYTTVSISDDVVTKAEGVNLDQYRGGPLNGCNAYHETVTVQVRSKADVISVNKYARHLGEGAEGWKTSITAKPGDDIEYLIKFKNEGNTQLNDVMVGDNMPKYIGYVNGTTMIQNGVFPNGTSANNDNLTKGGFNSGNYLPGATGYVWFRAKVDPLQAYEKCNLGYDTRNVGVVRPAGMNEFYNTAQVVIQVDCENQPESSYSCDLLKAEVGQNRNVKFHVNASADGAASIKNYVFDFGDGNTLTTDKVDVEHTYKTDGQFVTRVKVNVDVEGENKVAESDACAAVVNFTTPEKPTVTPVTTTPTTLPQTGAGSTIAIFAAVTAIATGAYYAVVRRNA